MFNYSTEFNASFVIQNSKPCEYIHIYIQTQEYVQLPHPKLIIQVEGTSQN